MDHLGFGYTFTIRYLDKIHGIYLWSDLTFCYAFFQMEQGSFHNGEDVRCALIIGSFHTRSGMVILTLERAHENTDCISLHRLLWQRATHGVARRG